MKPWRQAIDLIDQNVAPLDVEPVPLVGAYGRFLQSALIAKQAVPVFDLSAMDGFALRSEEALEGNRLEIVGTQAAGPGNLSISMGQAVRVMTGGQIPVGADIVVRKEDVEESSNQSIVLKGSFREGDHIRRKGEDVRADEEVLSRYQEIDSRVIGVVAAQGLSTVEVCRKPKVEILPTGSEIVEVGSENAEGRTFNSNAHMLESLVHHDGGRAVRSSIVSDDREALRASLVKGLESDLLITIGGVSVGDFDYVRDELEALNVEVIFHKLAIRPGKPLLFGVRRDPKPTYIFGLPGNPVSTYVTYEVFVRTAIKKMLGSKKIERKKHSARLREPYTKKKELTTFARARVTEEGGELEATITRGQGSHMLHALCRSNALLILEAGKEKYDADELVPFFALKEMDG